MEHQASSIQAVADASTGLSTTPLGALAAPENVVRDGMKLVCLDLGTDTGVCFKTPGTPLRSWTFCLARDDELETQRREGKERTLDIRFVRLFHFVREQIHAGVTGFVIEDVGFVSTRMQTQLWASLRSAIWAAILLHPGVQMFCVPVATLKCFATGNTRAQKEDMARALVTRRPQDHSLLEGRILKADGTVADHNEVDAIWLALYAEAVERGERAFLGVHQRKLLKAAERKLKKEQRKAKNKQRRLARRAQEEAKRQAVQTALKSLGRCCGVFRRQDRNVAVCPKCGRRVALPKIQVPPAVTGDQESVPRVIPTIPEPCCPSSPTIDFTQVPQHEPQPFR